MALPVAKIFIVALLVQSVVCGGAPIWEFLSYEEKMSKLMMMFLRMVANYCRNSTVPDCKKVISLYGTTNLMKFDNDALDHLDPNQRNANRIIWKAAMKSDYKMTATTKYFEVYGKRHPYATRVAPPKGKFS